MNTHHVSLRQSVEEIRLFLRKEEKRGDTSDDFIEAE
jgi:hypothetical protein